MSGAFRTRKSVRFGERFSKNVKNAPENVNYLCWDIAKFIVTITLNPQPVCGSTV
jgi:hypothetical protein